MAKQTDSPTLDELFAKALAADEAGEQVVEPVVEEEATDEGGEQSEEVAVPAKLSDLFEQPEKSDSIAPTVDLAQEVTLPDGTKKPLKELVDGYMMRSDYTQKTQTLADEKKTFEAAKELYDMLQDDPEGTILALAQKVGIQLGQEQTFNQSRKQKDVSKIVKGEEDKITALVEAKAKEVLEQYRKNDPALQELEVRQSQVKVQKEFDRIQDNYQYPLDEADRNALIQIAIQNNEPNLEYIFLKAKSALENKKVEAERVNATRVRKSSATPLPSVADALKVKPKTIEESFKLAELQLANK